MSEARVCGHTRSVQGSSGSAARPVHPRNSLALDPFGPRQIRCSWLRLETIAASKWFGPRGSRHAVDRDDVETSS
eukprot:3706827-Pyramimonas_sp.AAC.1